MKRHDGVIMNLGVLPQTAVAAFVCALMVVVSAGGSEPVNGEGSDSGALVDRAGEDETLVAFSTGELRSALEKARAGVTILIAPGNYSRGIFLRDVNGTREAPIVISAMDATNPPVITGGNEGGKLSSCSYVKLRFLTFKNFGSNGINIDDGGKPDQPSHHIILERLIIEDIGPRGNNDALKMSGVDHFVVRDCHFEGWGGSGIDLVGCHSGVIEESEFIGGKEYRNKNAIQIKGGSSEILVQTSYFENCGERIIHIGGSTGLPYFRPPDARSEASQVVVAGNRFVGGEAQIAWVTSRDSHVHHNLFYLPEKWLARIIQESKDPRFMRCQTGLFEENIVVTDDRVRTFVNASASGGTDPHTFCFRRNAWYRDGSGDEPKLPTKEIEGIYGIDPQIESAGSLLMRVGSFDPQLMSIGPGAYEPWAHGDDFDDVDVPKAEWAAPPPPAWYESKYLQYAILAVVVIVFAATFKRLKGFAEKLGL